MKRCFSAPRVALLLAVLAAIPAFAQDQWIRLTTTHFEMYASCDRKKASEAILYFERVRDFFMQASPVRPPAEFPTRIVAFKNADVFHIYAPNQLIRAYYAPGPVRDSIVMEDPSPESYPVTIHEYVHLVVRHSGLHIPLWLNEGWAEVFSTLKPVKDGVAVGDLIEPHVKALEQGQWFSLNQLEAINNRSPEYNEASRIGMFYAESWALAHMLYLSPDYKNGFGAFIGALNKGRSLDDALRTAYNKTSEQVFADLHNYLNRKKLYGTVFLTPFEKSGETPVVTPVTTYDSNLMLADLQTAAHHLADAIRFYRQLETDDPKRPEAFAAEGYMAIRSGDKETARKEFRQAFVLGTGDPQLCMQLATLDREVKQPVTRVMEELARAVELRPDFSEAMFELAILKVETRDFDAALRLLGRVGTVGPDRMTIFHSALAYSNLEEGNIDAARSNAEAARRAAKTPAQTSGADRLIRLIDARSKGPAAVLPGEKDLRAEGTAAGLRCAAPGSGDLSKMGIVIGGKQMIFDMPEPAAVEVTHAAGESTELKCGPLQPFRVIVEYAPASVANRQSAGIIRRLEF